MSENPVFQVLFDGTGRTVWFPQAVTVQDVNNEIVDTYPWDFFQEDSADKIKTAISRCVVLNQMETLIARLLEGDPDWPGQRARLVFHPISPALAPTRNCASVVSECIIVPEQLEVLSEREIDILARLGRGVSASKAAKDLFIERTTVDTHLRRIREKLDLHEILDVIIWAARYNKAIQVGKPSSEFAILFDGEGRVCWFPPTFTPDTQAADPVPNVNRIIGNYWWSWLTPDSAEVAKVALTRCLALGEPLDVTVKLLPDNRLWPNCWCKLHLEPILKGEDTPRESVALIAKCKVMPSRFELLSVREKEVIAMIADGLCAEAASVRLNVARSTVDSYLARIKKKLELDEIIQVIAWGVEYRDLL